MVKGNCCRASSLPGIGMPTMALWHAQHSMLVRNSSTSQTLQVVPRCRRNEEVGVGAKPLLLLLNLTSPNATTVLELCKLMVLQTSCIAFWRLIFRFLLSLRWHALLKWCCTASACCSLCLIWMPNAWGSATLAVGVLSKLACRAGASCSHLRLLALCSLVPLTSCHLLLFN